MVDDSVFFKCFFLLEFFNCFLSLVFWIPDMSLVIRNRNLGSLLVMVMFRGGYGVARGVWVNVLGGY